MEKTPRAHMFRLDALADVARADVHVHILCLARPERKPANQGSRFLAPEVAPERRVVTFLEDALAKVAALRDAKAIGLPLAPAVEQPTSYQERTTSRPVARRSHWQALTIN